MEAAIPTLERRGRVFLAATSQKRFHAACDEKGGAAYCAQKI